MKHTLKIIVLSLCVALLGACSKKAVYTTESFATDSPFELKVVDDTATACESARRSLLRQGYLIEKAGDENVKGRKAYNSADSRNTFIEMNVVCVPDISGSTVFANGVLSTYELKKSSSAASVGVSAVGSISLPIGQSADSLVKVSEETIGDTAFYNRFFAAVARILGDMRAAAQAAAPVPEPDPEPIPEPGPASTMTAPAPAAVQAAPEPGPVQTAPTAVPEPGALPAALPEPAPSPSAVPEPGALPVALPESAPAAGPVVPEPVTAQQQPTFGPGPASPPATAPPAPATTPVPAPVPTAPADGLEPIPLPTAPDDGLEPIPVPGADALLR
jgi:hypothetical protein